MSQGAPVARQVHPDCYYLLDLARAFAEWVARNRVYYDGVCFAINGDTMYARSEEALDKVQRCTDWIVANGAVVERRPYVEAYAVRVPTRYGTVTLVSLVEAGEPKFGYRIEFEDGLVSTVTLNKETGTLCITACSPSNTSCTRDRTKGFWIE